MGGLRAEPGALADAGGDQGMSREGSVWLADPSVVPQDGLAVGGRDRGRRHGNLGHAAGPLIERHRGHGSRQERDGSERAHLGIVINQFRGKIGSGAELSARTIGHRKNYFFYTRLQSGDRIDDFYFMQYLGRVDVVVIQHGYPVAAISTWPDWGCIQVRSLGYR